jgi:hypothetical protein
MTTPRITGVGVLVPARDEQDTIRDCLRALRTAMRGLPADVEPAVCVVADRCADATAAAAAEEFGGWTAARVVVNSAELTIGEVRNLGLRHVCAQLAGHRPERVWLLSTDADTVVAPDWIRAHLRHARTGAHAVAGVAELTGHAQLPGALVRRYAQVLARAVRPEGHGNVYAANLGVRADAYQAVGGFGAVPTGEDHDLWGRLGEAGFHCHYTERARVCTSARRVGRATGGLSDLLSELDSAEPGTGPYEKPEKWVSLI